MNAGIREILTVPSNIQRPLKARQGQAKTGNCMKGTGTILI